MRAVWDRLSRTCALLGALAGLGACVAQPNPYAYSPPATRPAPAAPVVTPPGRRIVVLLPLTGPSGEIGQAMLNGARLATDAPGASPLDSQDTRGTTDGAARAARAALANGAGLIVGPLTAGETSAVAPIARAAGVPVLAFTSDRTQSQPGVWTLGITPAQQVRTLVRAVQAENKTRLAAVLPSNTFGDALAEGLTEATAAAGLPPAQIVRFGVGLGGLETALRDLAGPPAPDGAPPAPPPVDALLLGTDANVTAQAAPLLARYGLGADRVRLLGTALWARDATRLSAIAGAWYAAPDPAIRAGFETRYAAKFGAPPRDLASIAFDATAAAQSAAGPNGFDPAVLLRPDGFEGADGVFVLQPDGRVRRGLAVFEIGPAGARVRQPAPRSLSAPGA